MLLPPACTDIVGHRIAAHVIKGIFLRNIAGISPDQDSEFSLEIDLGHGIVADPRKTNRIGRSAERRGVLEEDDRILSDFVTKFLGMFRIVPADADDRGWSL